MLVLDSTFTSWGICGCLVTLHAHEGHSFWAPEPRNLWISPIHPSILPPTSIPCITYPFTHPTHPSTHPPLSSHPFQPATCTIERQTVEHSRGSPRAPRGAAWRLLQVAFLRAWPQALEPQESALVSWVLRRVTSL